MSIDVTVRLTNLGCEIEVLNTAILSRVKFDPTILKDLSVLPIFSENGARAFTKPMNFFSRKTFAFPLDRFMTVLPRTSIVMAQSPIQLRFELVASGNLQFPILLRFEEFKSTSEARALMDKRMPLPKQS
jgi:hypothetical protein